MAIITQDMRFRLALIKYADKYGVSKAAARYKTNRQYVYRWKRRYDGSWLLGFSQRSFQKALVLVFKHFI